MNISDANTFCFQLSEIVRSKDEINFTKIFNPEELDENEYKTLVENLNSLVCYIYTYGYHITFSNIQLVIFIYLFYFYLLLFKFIILINMKG